MAKKSKKSNGSRPHPQRDSKSNQGYRHRKFEKDPMIAFVMNKINESGLTFGQIEAKCGVSRSTLHNWDIGETKRPQKITMQLVLRETGHDIGVFKISNNARVF